MCGHFEIGGRSWLGLSRLGHRGICLIELQAQSDLSGFGPFGGVPESKVADFVQSLGENVLQKAAHELVAG